MSRVVKKKHRNNSTQVRRIQRRTYDSQNPRGERESYASATLDCSIHSRCHVIMSTRAGGRRGCNSHWERCMVSYPSPRAYILVPPRLRSGRFISSSSPSVLKGEQQHNVPRSRQRSERKVSTCRHDTY